MSRERNKNYEFRRKSFRTFKKKRVTPNKMLVDLEINHGALGDWIKKNQTPNGVNIAKIANYLDVSTDYLLGLTDDPTPPKKREEMTEEEKLAAEVFKMTPDKKSQLVKYAEFLKTQEELSQELDVNSLKPQHE